MLQSHNAERSSAADTAAVYRHMNETVQTPAGSSSRMETAALILGIFSIIMMATGFSLVIGSVGVILALLSRGSGRLSGKAKGGLITSLIGIIGGILVTAVVFLTLFQGDLNQTLERLDSLYQTYIDEGTINSSDIDRIFFNESDGSDEEVIL